MFVTASDGASYDSQDYNNIKYTATGTGVGQTWAYDVNTPVLLSKTKGKVYAYYPRQTTGVSLNAITIYNDGNDWMYTPSASPEVSMLNPTAQLEMKHAMTILRVKVVGGNADSDGTISSLTVDGNGWATSATLDLQNGTIGSYVGEGTQLAASNLGTLNTTGVSHDFWLVSKMTASVITFTVKVGSDEFRVSTPSEITLERGKVYNYTLKVENKIGAELSSVLLTDWIAQANVDMETEYNPWGGLADGVYAIDNAGNLVDYTTASDAEAGTYKGVALVMNGKAIEIAPSDASTSTKWADASLTTDQQAIFSSYYIKKVDGTHSYGYLKMPNGTYISSNNNISDDISTWTEGALYDVDGKANTDRIIAAGVTIASVINDYNDGNHGSTSWYLPAAGQLAYMFMNYNKINDLLTKVSGTSMSTSDYYWSSSVYSAAGAWLVYFYRGHVDCYDVTYARRVRLVRDL